MQARGAKHEPEPTANVVTKSQITFRIAQKLL
jgi:hypothetical protein